MTKDQFFTHCVMKLGPPGSAAIGAQHIDDYWEEVLCHADRLEKYADYSYVDWRAWCEAQKTKPE